MFKRIIFTLLFIPTFFLTLKADSEEEKKIKAEVITMIKNMGEVNNKTSPAESKIIEKIINTLKLI